MFQKEWSAIDQAIIKRISQEASIPLKKVQSTVSLLDDDKTIPFIARYRKEMTGELDEVQIRQIDELLGYYRNLEQKKEDILRTIDEQGKLTDDLRTQINATSKLSELEDLYRPYRPKRKTRASMAREKGLQGLADFLLEVQDEDPCKQEALQYFNDVVLTVEDALHGAQDILAEQIADDPNVRKHVRNYTRRFGSLVSHAKDAEKDSVYTMYYAYQEPVSKIPAHRILAINRGEKETFIKTGIEVQSESIVGWMNRQFAKNEPPSDLITAVIQDAYKRLLQPAVERDLRNELTEKAEDQALQVFSKNLRSLLLQAPVKGKRMLGIDPAYRTGCKWAVVDTTGKMIEIGVFYPTPPRSDIAGALKTMDRLVKQYEINAIVIGNGTGSRETEQFVADFIQETGLANLAYTIASEAGASVYSASKLAAEEFPQLDVAERSAISIARRVQDPLAELVKIEPKSCGVGQYQHDIAAKRLDENLSAVVESAVNYVGVDVNTASPSLLKYVAGINGTVATNVVKYRDEIGGFENRRQLLKVPKLGPKTYEQAIGFLRIASGKNQLDATPIHPESYPLTQALLNYVGGNLDQIGTEALNQQLIDLDIHQVAQALEAGVPTLRDIIDALLRPGRDPREDLPPAVFRKDVLSIEDLQTGMEFQGVVRNVVDFGAFVDIGVKVDGLVHISQMSANRIKHPMEVISLGDIVQVWVLSVDVKHKRIALTMVQEK
ncbi:MAG: Tex family protein [Bacillota bacterium]|nr:Tex family protein [Bacillota bacterium]